MWVDINKREPPIPSPKMQKRGKERKGVCLTKQKRLSKDKNEGWTNGE